MSAFEATALVVVAMITATPGIVSLFLRWQDRDVSVRHTNASSFQQNAAAVNQISDAAVDLMKQQRARMDSMAFQLESQENELETQAKQITEMRSMIDKMRRQIKEFRQGISILTEQIEVLGKVPRYRLSDEDKRNGLANGGF